MNRAPSPRPAAFNGSSRHGQLSAQKRRACPGLESLEVRQLMAARPTHWVIVQQPANIVAGSPITFKVEAVSYTGKVIYLSNWSINLSLWTNPTGTGITPPTFSSTEATNGVITLSGFTINQAGYGYSIKISGTGNGLTLQAAHTALFNVAQGAPGVLTWTGRDLHLGDWNDPLNWNLDRTPIDGDTLVFPSSATFFTSNNNMTGLVLAGIEVTGSNYLINTNSSSNQSTFGNQGFTTGKITISGSNDYVGLPRGSNLAGDIVDAAASGTNNYLIASDVNITNAWALMVSAGNVLNIFTDTQIAFSGSASLLLEGPGEICQSGGARIYNTCTTVLVSASFYLGSADGGLINTPQPWGPIILEGGTLGVVPGSHYAYAFQLPDVTIEGFDVTLENIALQFQENNTDVGDVNLILADAIVRFAPGLVGDGAITVIASTSDAWAYGGGGGIVYMPTLDDVPVTAQGPNVTVYDN
jgi:hypothetical protein